MWYPQCLITQEEKVLKNDLRKLSCPLDSKAISLTIEDNWGNFYIPDLVSVQSKIKKVHQKSFSHIEVRKKDQFYITSDDFDKISKGDQKYDQDEIKSLGP